MMWRLVLLSLVVATVLFGGVTQAQMFDITSPGDAIVGMPDDGVSTGDNHGWPAAEAPPLVIDNNLATKFLHFKGEIEPTGFRVTPSQAQYVIKALNFYSANDSAPRDPVAFRLSGSNESIDGPYVVIAEGTIDEFDQATAYPRLTWIKTPVEIANGAAFKHYEVLFTEVRDAASANSMQIGEVELLTDGSLAGAAAAPSPMDGETDVLRNVALEWVSGAYNGVHNVYFGQNLADVEAATVSNPLGVLRSEGQQAPKYVVPERLEFGTTYYWRVDEVNTTPDRTVYGGEVWSFTTEKYVLPITDIVATASVSNVADGQTPDKTIDGSGLNPDDSHGKDLDTMWQGAGDGVNPVWIQYEFDKAYKLYEMWVWNSNQALESLFGFGVKGVVVEYSADGTDWNVLEGVTEFARGTGKPTYQHNTTVAFDGVMAKYVKITIQSNHGGLLPQYGLSEVRFYAIPIFARKAQPASGATVDTLDVMLTWRAGRDAGQHQVYVSSDEDAVINSDPAALIDTINETSLSLSNAGLEYATTYYWRVAEVNDAAMPALASGDVWEFSIQDHMVIDDFEQYSNEPIERPFYTWIDGFGYTTPEPGHPGNGTGAGIGHDIWTPLSETLMETAIVTGGAQSMPVYYDNTGINGKTTYAEAIRTWDQAQNWARGATNTLIVNFRGNPGSFKVEGNSITVGGMGTDIAGAADEFNFVFKQLNGDGSIVAKVDSIMDSAGQAKAGIMIRETTYADATFAMVVVTPGGGLSFQGRLANGQNPEITDQVGQAPYWVKLTRTGNVFKAQTSADGVTWSNLTDVAEDSSVEIVMNGNALIGLAVTSADALYPTVAEFSNVSTTGGASGSWQAEAIGVAIQPDNSDEPLYIKIEDSAGRSAKVSYANATVIPSWTRWEIPFSELGNVNLSAVKKMTLGIGNTTGQAGGTGLVFYDDIQVQRAFPVEGLQDVTSPGDYSKAVPYDGDWPANEWSGRAIDNKANTKLLHFAGATETSGLQVTPSVGATIVTGLAFTSANDSANRDPVTFELYGSNAGIQGPYTLIVSGDIVDFSQETAWPRLTKNETPISFDNDTAYLHYQILFPTIRDAATANSMQIGEVELLGVSAQ